MGRLLFLILVFVCSDADCWVRTFGNTDNQRITSMASTPDGILVAANDNSGDAWLMKINAQGEVLWQKSYSVGTVSSINTISILSDNNIIAAGMKPLNDIWILKLDPDGNVLWEKTDTDVGLTSASQISATSDGGFFITAARFDSSTQDVWVLKLDGNGNSIWQHGLDAQGFQDLAFGGKQTSDGGFIVSNFRNFKQGPDSSHSLWLVKLNSSGAKVWERVYGTDVRQGSRVHQTSDGGYILSGSIFRVGKALDLWVLKLNSSGSIVWQTALGGPLDEDGDVFPVSDGYVVTGFTYSYGFGERDVWVVKLDLSGNVIWQKSYGGSLDDYASAFVPLSTGYLIGGTTESFGQGDTDVWMLKVDSNGEISDECTVSQDTTAIAYNPMETSQSFNGNYFALNTPIVDDNLPTDSWMPVVATQCCSITLNPTSLPIGEINKPYNATLTTDTTTATFTISQGNLPDGLSLDSMTGVISGTPTTAGSSFFEITVADTLGCSESRMYRIDTVNCLLCDDFEDGILNQQWTYPKGTWQETNGSLFGQTTRKAAALASPIFSGCSLCTIRTTLQMTAGVKPRLTFVGWHQDKSNRVELLVKPDQDKWILRQKHEGKVATKKKVTLTVDPGIFYDVAIQYDGSLLRLIVNDVEVLTLTPVPEAEPMGTVGFELKATNGTFQSIMVY